jgi:transcription termination factor NusB
LLFCCATGVDANASCGSLDDIWRSILEIEGTVAVEQQKGDEIYVVDERSNAFQKLYSNCVEKAISKNASVGLSDEELHTIFMILNHVNFYTPSDASLSLFSKFVSEISEDNNNLDNYKEKYYEKLWKSWQFDKLRLIKQTDVNAKIYSLPVIESNRQNRKKGYRRFRVINQDLLQEDYIDLSSGNVLVVVGSTLCSPSKRFTSWFDENVDGLKNTDFSVVWLTRQFEESRFNNVDSFNKKHKHVEFSFIRTKDDWPFVSYWGTPTMYFLTDGKLKAQIVGWPTEGRENEMYQKINKYFID